MQKSGICNVGLLGTRYTMEGDFLKEKLEAVVGNVSDETKSLFIGVIDEFARQGAQNVILKFSADCRLRVLTLREWVIR